jgi:hypothetical protein
MKEEEKKEDGGPPIGAPKNIAAVQNSLLREIYRRKLAREEKI